MHYQVIYVLLGSFMVHSFPVQQQQKQQQQGLHVINKEGHTTPVNDIDINQMHPKKFEISTLDSTHYRRENIINAPIRGCPDGYRRDFLGQCRRQF